LRVTPNARTVLERRYLKKVDGKVVESPEDMLRRVARVIAAVDAQYGASEEEVAAVEETFFRMMDAREMLPNSPTLMNAGRELGQLSACFVLPIEDSMRSIFDSLKYTALIHQSGGGTGFSFSRLRPKRDIVRSTGGVASGPVSFMKVYDASTEAVKQGGSRRGANMGILRVDHPDILEFITCKRDNDDITNFNISVAVTDAFMEAVERGEEYELVNPRDGSVVRKLDAREVFDLIVEMAWNNGEPGVIFIDRINADNPTPHVGEIESTNPCGEQPLLPYESCNLGSINLTLMVDEPAREVDWEKLRRTVHQSIHFLDNVIDANRYPLEQIERMTKANRKVGLGVMGWAGMLIKLGIAYDSEEAVGLAERVMRFIRDEARAASAELARQRGPFPNFRGSVFDKAGMEPLRNATTTTIAPTGTISIIADCTSGIEPLFSVAFTRTVLDDDRLVEVNPLFEEVAKEGGFYSPELMRLVAQRGTLRGIEEVPEDVRRIFVTAHDISPEWHVRMQAAFQKYTDNAVSKTVNFPQSATKEDVAKVYNLAYELGCKGVTVYRAGSRDREVLTVGSDKDGAKAKKGEREVIEPRPRPRVTHGRTERIDTGCGKLYVTVNEDEHGLCEVFTQMGKSGGCASSQSEAISRLISLALRAGVKPEAIIKHLRGIRCPAPSWQQGGMVLSCADAVGIVLERYVRYRETGVSEEFVAASQDNLVNHTGACPECGGHMKHEEGCATCLVCGYSKCS